LAGFDNVDPAILCVLSCFLDTLSCDMFATGFARAPARAGLRMMGKGISVIEPYALHRRTAVAAKVRVLTS
jgi:hypothetical protein